MSYRLMAIGTTSESIYSGGQMGHRGGGVVGTKDRWGG